MKPWIAIQESHDSSVCIFYKNDFYFFELEKISGFKHHHVLRNYNMEGKVGPQTRERIRQLWEDIKKGDFESDENLKKNYELNTETMRKVLKMAEEQFGIPNDFDLVLYKGLTRNPFPEESYFDRSIIKYDRWQISQCNHHLAHAFSAHNQSPYQESNVITFDAGGDEKYFICHQFRKDRLLTREENLFFGHAYNTAAMFIKEIRENSSIYDYAGKVMGMAAYGKPDETLVGMFKKLIRYPVASHGAPIPKEFGVHEKAEEYAIYEKDFNSYNIKNQIKPEVIAASVQVAFEDTFIEQLKIYDAEKRYPLILCGGCALNVLLNERLRREGWQVYVPPNPHDSGLPHGMLIDRLMIERKFMLRKKHTTMYSGPYIEEFRHNTFRRTVRKRRPVMMTMDDLVTVLKTGHIVGLINGRIENGPRALGNRSILCDPSFPDMKDKLNAKVKNREWFRPFAPACIYEEAEKYFDFSSKENMESMSFAARTREEYKSRLAAVTHVDGTARLQTVKKEDNPFFHSLLTNYKGVLLNTSFNVQGKPILNSLKDAFEVLDNTELDYVVYHRDGKIFSWT